MRPKRRNLRHFGVGRQGVDLRGELAPLVSKIGAEIPAGGAPILGSRFDALGSIAVILDALHQRPGAFQGAAPFNVPTLSIMCRIPNIAPWESANDHRAAQLSGLMGWEPTR